MSTPANRWTQLYQQVAREMGMPARGPSGSPQNKERQRLAGRVAAETTRRYQAEQHGGKS